MDCHQHFRFHRCVPGHPFLTCYSKLNSYIFDNIALQPLLFHRLAKRVVEAAESRRERFPDPCLTFHRDCIRMDVARVEWTIVKEFLLFL